MMDYEQFKEHVKENITGFLPKEYADAEVTIQSVMKNNDVQLSGVLIKTEETNIAPNIYLEGYYEKVKDGAELDDVMQDIARVRVENEMQSSFDVTFLTDLDKVKDKIICKLVNAEANEEYLSDKPFTQLEDLAVVYAVDLGSNAAGHMSAAITDRLMEGYGLNTGQLHEIAMDNLNRAPLEFKSMREVLAEMMFPDMDKDDPLISVMLPPEDPTTMMYVVSNEEKLNGATAILSQKMMDDIAEKLGGDFVVLPSSIHECIVVPLTENMDRNTLETMVQEINAGHVAPEERLSDHVYVYDSTEHELLRADKMEERSKLREAAKDTVQDVVSDAKPKRQENSLTDKIARKQAQIAKNETTRENPVKAKTKDVALA